MIDRIKPLLNRRYGKLQIKYGLQVCYRGGTENSEHGDIPMFKNHLDVYLANIPDQPTVTGEARGAQTNSLLHQIPFYEYSI